MIEWVTRVDTGEHMIWYRLHWYLLKPGIQYTGDQYSNSKQLFKFDHYRYFLTASILKLVKVL